MSRKMEYTAQEAVNILNNSNSYPEFKMKLDLAGIDLYNIPVLKSVRYRMTGSMLKQFTQDVSENMDIPKLNEYALNVIRVHMRNDGTKLGGFDTFIANIWIEKYEREYRKDRKPRYTKPRQVEVDRTI